ncbi:MAG: hypothetical protein V4556_10975 [Bacteroidota bacterium]
MRRTLPSKAMALVLDTCVASSRRSVKLFSVICCIVLVLMLSNVQLYGQCGAACTATITSGTIASGEIKCVSATTASGIIISNGGRLVISGTGTTVSNITISSGAIVEICGTNNTITFNALPTGSYQVIVNAGATGNTINSISQTTAPSTLTFTNNLTGTDFITINATSSISLTSTGSGNTFTHAGTGITKMNGAVRQTTGNSFTLAVTGGDLRLGAVSGISVDYNQGNGGAGSIVNISAGAKFTTSGCIDYGTSVSTTGGINNLGTATIGVNSTGWSIVKRSGNNVPFLNGNSSNSNAILIMTGGVDMEGNTGTFTNYGLWSIGASTGNAADGVVANGGNGHSFYGNKPSIVITNNNTGTMIFTSGIRTGGGTAWTLTNNGVMHIGKNTVFGTDRNVSIQSGDFMTINNGTASFTNAILTTTGAIYGRSSNAFALNNYGCFTTRNISLTRQNPATINLFTGSALNFTGSNSLNVTANGTASGTINWASNTDVARGDFINTTSGTLARIESVTSATQGIIGTADDGTTGATVAAVAGPYNSVYSLISRVAGSYAVNIAVTGTASMQLAGLGVRATNVTKTSGTLNVYKNGTANDVVSATNTAGSNPTTCNATIKYSGTLSELAACSGTASAPTTFAVAGVNMTAGILVTPPSGFEVSLSEASGYASTVTVGAAGGIAGTIVYVRLSSAASAGTYSGNIVLSSAGATNVNVPTISSVVVGTPTVVLSSPGTDLSAAAGSTCKGGLNDPIFNFQLSVTVSGAILNQVDFTTTGSHVNADITNYKLWYNASSNSLNGAMQVGAAITGATGAGAHSFTGLTQSISSGSTGYFIITADIAVGATTGRTIQVSQMTTSNITFQCGASKSGTTTLGGSGLQTVGASALTVTPTSSANPVYYGTSVTLSAGVSGGSGSQTYSWSSLPAFFSGTAATSIATVTPTQNFIIATVLVQDGYCAVSGTITEKVSIPYVGVDYHGTTGASSTNGNATALSANLPATSGYPIPGPIYLYNYNTGTATATNTGSLDFNEVNTNEGNSYNRTITGTNLGVETEANGGSGITYNISNTASGEFLAYTVNIANAGTYDVTFRVANGSGAASTNQFKLQLDGVDITSLSAVTVPNSGWGTWTDQTVTGVVIPSSGIHTLKFVENAGVYNISKITFTCTAPTAAVLSGTASICTGNSTNLSVAITGGASPYTVVLHRTIGSDTTITNYISGTNIVVTPSATITYNLVSVTSACGTAGTGLSGTPTVTVSGTPPDVVLASPGTDLSAADGSTCKSGLLDPVYNFQLSATTASATVNQVNFSTTGTHVDADITNYKLWFNPSTNSLVGAGQIGSSITLTTGAGSHSFTGLAATVSINTTGYFIITADIAPGATTGRTIKVTAITTSDISLACINSFTGSTSVSGGGTQTIAASALTVTPTASANPVYYGTSVTLSAGVSGASGSQTYSWSSVPAFFSGTAATSMATVTPTQNFVIATVLVQDGYCAVSGSITEKVSIPYAGTDYNSVTGAGTLNPNRVNVAPTTGYTLPGIVYAYNYNTGTSPTAGAVDGVLDYHDNDAASNGGGNYRPNTGVDFESNGGQYNVSNIFINDTLAYIVNVATAGTYIVTYNVARGDAATLTSACKLLVDGVAATGSSADILTTGGNWSDYAHANSNPTAVVTFSTAGIHTLKFVATNTGFNIRRITFTCPTSTAAVLSATGPIAICDGSSTTLSVAITPSTGTYTVVYSDGTSNFTVPGYTSGNAITVSPTSTKTYSLVSVTSSCGNTGTGLSGTPSITVSSNPPDVVLASPGTDLAAATASTCKTVTNDPIYNFQLSATTFAGTVNQVNFTTTGTHAAADITNYKLWLNSSSNSLTGATQVGSAITTGTGAGAHSFTGLTAIVPVNTTGYFIVTTDIASGATTGNTIKVTALTTGDITLACSNSFTGSTNASGSGTQTIAAAIMVVPTASANPVYYGTSVILSAGVTGAGGSETYSWSSVPAFFSGTSATSSATLTPSQNFVTATVLVQEGYCSVSGSIIEKVSIPFAGTDYSSTTGVGTLNANRVNVAPTTGYAIPGYVYPYNFNTGTAPASATDGLLDYQDNGASSNGNYRPTTGVDFESNGGEYNISQIFAGETLSFTVNIAATGAYKITYNVARGDASTLTPACKVQLDGVDVASSSVDIQTTGGSWSNFAHANSNPFTTVTINTTGTHTLKFVALNTGFNLRSIRFEQTCSVPTPTFTAQPGASACVGADVTYTTESGNTNYLWTIPGVLNTDYSITSGGTTSDNTVVLKWLTTGNKTVSINYTVTGGCTAVSPTPSTATTVNARPVPTFTAEPGAVACSNTDVTYTTESGNSNYVWTIPGVLNTDYSITSGGTTSDNTVVLKWLTTGSKTVTVNYTNVNGCAALAATSSTATTINALPLTPVANNDGPKCVGSTLSLSTATVASATYSWTGPNSFTSNDQNPEITNATAAATGTYSVTVTVNGCTSAAGTTNAVVNSLPATPTAGNDGPKCIGSTLSLSASTISGATYAWTGPNSFTSTDQNPTIPSATSAATGTYSVIATVGGCSSAAGTTDAVVSTNQWLGGTSQSWGLSANWSCGVPSASTDVTIPSGAPRYPSLSSGTISARNITIQNGALITVSGTGILRIGGSVTNEGTGIINATAGTIELNGTSNQSFAGSSYLSSTVKILRISNTAGVTLTNTLNITDNVSFGSVSNSTLSSGGFLVIKSTETATARVGQLLNGNTITGNLVVERYIPQNVNRGWRMLAIPTGGSQTIHNAWQEGQTGLGANNNLGTIITSKLGTDADPSPAINAGFDFHTTASSIKEYNPAPSDLGAWEETVTSTNVPIARNSGYMLYIRGDRSIGPSSSISAGSPTVLRTTGPLVVPAEIPVINERMALVGNVYPSAIDFDALTKSNVSRSFIVWDPKLTGVYGLGAYQYPFWDGEIWDVIPGEGSYASGPYNIIQSGQAFFVQSDGNGDGSVQLGETSKVSGSKNVYRPLGNGIATKLKTRLYVVNGTTSNLLDGNTVIFDNLDDNDIKKVENSGENIGILSKLLTLSVDARPAISDEDTVFFKMWRMRPNTYKLELDANTLFSIGATAFLEDKYLKTSQALSLEILNTVSFIVNADPGSFASDRFRVVFKVIETVPVRFTTISANQKNTDIQVDWKVENETNIEYYVIEHSIDGINFTEKNKVNKGNISNYSWLDTKPSTIANYYRVKSVSISGEEKYSSIIKVIVGNSETSIVLVNNPVSNTSINLRFNNQSKGKYIIRMMNTLGQQLMNKAVDYYGGSSIQTVMLPKLISSGVYHLEIVKPNGTKVKEKFVIN